MSFRNRRWIALCLVAGCRDRAAPGLSECRALEARGELEQAAIVCSEAALADPASKAGREAKGLVDALRAKAVEKRQRDEAEALVRAAESQRQAEARCPSHDWVTVCDIGPHSGALQHFSTRRECDAFATSPAVRCSRCRCY
jgi:hypothetical protein